MSTNDPRRAILARRARFVAAAVAGMGLVGCGDDGPQPNPQVCLSPALDGSLDQGTDAADTGPTPCLTPILDAGLDTSPDAADAPADLGGDSGADLGGDSGADLGGDASDTEPTPCLKMAPDTGDAD